MRLLLSQSLVVLAFIDMTLLLYSKSPKIRTLNFEGLGAVGSYLMIMSANINLLGS